MASLTLISCSLPPSLFSSDHHAHFSPKPSRFSIHAKPSRSPVSSKATNSDQNQNEDQGNKFDRRNMLLGMGGLYGAAANQLAFAEPVPPPDFTKCFPGTNLNTQQPLDVNCCPPVSQNIIDYKLPPVYKMRYRPAAHTVTKEYIAKYKYAIELMKNLPSDDPRSFMQQANVHCAYCNLTFEETGHENVRLQIHDCWHFFPWHRWYLYFYERILGKLIGDPHFGLPYWNWDNPHGGMTMPAMFVDPSSSLFNDKRNQNHLPPKLVDLGYSSGANENKPSAKVILDNLCIVYRDVVCATKPESFYGRRYVAGNPPNPGPGSVDRGCHNAVHMWVGDPRQPSQEDMGNFYSTGREPLFYSHHANIDRLWSIWRDLRGPKPKDFKDPDWLNTTFVFYDENKQLVRVKVCDTLENRKMGYVYQPMFLPWLINRPIARAEKSTLRTTSGAPPVSSTVFPLKLDKVFSVVVPRTKKSRSVQEKDEEEESLVIEGIEVDTGNSIKFDVFVNDIDNFDDFDKAEYAGTFSQVPHKNSSKVKTSITLALNELLEDLKVEDDDEIIVSLVPKVGGDDITIGGIKIIYTS